MVRQKNEVRPKYTTLSARVWVGQLGIIKRAAASVVPPMTVPEYVRYRLLPLAAQDAGEELPEFPSFAGRGRPSNVAAAAATLGMTVGDFRRSIVEDAAAQVVARARTILPPRSDVAPRFDARGDVRTPRSDVAPRPDVIGARATRSAR